MDAIKILLTEAKLYWYSMMLENYNCKVLKHEHNVKQVSRYKEKIKSTEEHLASLIEEKEEETE